MTPKPLYHPSFLTSCNPKTSQCQCWWTERCETQFENDSLISARVSTRGGHGVDGDSRGEGSIDSQGAKGGEVVPFGELSQPGKKGKKECSYVIDCLQKKKCDRDLFCRCHKGKCVNVRTNNGLGKRDCKTEKQVSHISFIILDVENSHVSSMGVPSPESQVLQRKDPLPFVNYLICKVHELCFTKRQAQDALIIRTCDK